jgi:trehalose 6-phosphate phosphatase
MPECPKLATPPLFSPADIGLFLDFDGTLVVLADRPDAVRLDPPLARLLARLSDRLAGRVALVSGRSVAQLDAIAGTCATTLAVVGSHGAEVRAVGDTGWQVERPAALQKAEAIVRQALGGCEGVVIEVKSLGVAVHYRQNPAMAQAARAVADDVADKLGLRMQEGKMMIELRTGGDDKGSGIAALMQAPPFAGHVPVFLGDDVTDEPGFATCKALGGVGILVGSPAATAASFRLDGVADVRDWLARL